MNNLNGDWIVKAVNTIKDGICNKLEKDNITIYKCGEIIRIDVKGAFEND